MLSLEKNLSLQILSNFLQEVKQFGSRSGPDISPDQAGQNVWPDLGPNGCKGYKQTTLAGKELNACQGQIQDFRKGGSYYKCVGGLFADFI